MVAVKLTDSNPLTRDFPDNSSFVFYSAGTAASLPLPLCLSLTYSLSPSFPLPLSLSPTPCLSLPLSYQPHSLYVNVCTCLQIYQPIAHTLSLRCHLLTTRPLRCLCWGMRMEPGPPITSRSGTRMGHCKKEHTILCLCGPLYQQSVCLGCVCVCVCVSVCVRVW